jgi:ABC-type uncharacterized transport system permease subunit
LIGKSLFANLRAEKKIVYCVVCAIMYAVNLCVNILFAVLPT